MGDSGSSWCPKGKPRDETTIKMEGLKLHCETVLLFSVVLVA